MTIAEVFLEHMPPRFRARKRTLLDRTRKLWSMAVCMVPLQLPNSVIRGITPDTTKSWVTTEKIK